MGKMMPPMMQVLRDIGGVELPGYLGSQKAEEAGPSSREVVPKDGYTAPEPKEGAKR
jgi:hypothetical protein